MVAVNHRYKKPVLKDFKLRSKFVTLKFQTEKEQEVKKMVSDQSLVDGFLALQLDPKDSEDKLVFHPKTCFKAGFETLDNIFM